MAMHEADGINIDVTLGINGVKIQQQIEQILNGIEETAGKIDVTLDTTNITGETKAVQQLMRELVSDVRNLKNDFATSMTDMRAAIIQTEKEMATLQQGLQDLDSVSQKKKKAVGHRQVDDIEQQVNVLKEQMNTVLTALKDLDHQDASTIKKTAKAVQGLTQDYDRQTQALNERNQASNPQQIINNEQTIRQAVQGTTSDIKEQNAALQELLNSTIAGNALNRNYSTTNQNKAEYQLGEAYISYGKYNNGYDRQVGSAFASEAGAAAAYAYIKAFQEGINQGLNPDLIMKAYGQKNWGTTFEEYTASMEVELSRAQKVLERYARYYQQILPRLNGEEMSTDLKKALDNLVYYEDMIKSWGSERKNMFSTEDIAKQNQAIANLKQTVADLTNAQQYASEQDWTRLMEESARSATETLETERNTLESVNHAGLGQNAVESQTQLQQATQEANQALTQQEKLLRRLNSVKTPNQLLNKDYSKPDTTRGKNSSLKQLEKAYNDYNMVFSDPNKFKQIYSTQAGTSAIYNYAKSLAEAFRHGIRERLEDFTIPGWDLSNMMRNAKMEIQHSEELLSKYATYYDAVRKQMQGHPITEDIKQEINKLVSAEDFKNSFGDNFEQALGTESVAKYNEYIVQLHQNITDLINTETDAVNQGQQVANTQQAEAQAVQAANTQIREQNQLLSELNIANPAQQLLNRDFGTNGKQQATTQLKQAYQDFQKVFGGLTADQSYQAMQTEAGVSAGYAYINAYLEALQKGIASSNLQKYTIPGWLDKNGAPTQNIDIIKNFLPQFEDILKEYSRFYNNILPQMNGATITPEISGLVEQAVTASRTLAEMKLSPDAFSSDQLEQASQKLTNINQQLKEAVIQAAATADQETVPGKIVQDASKAAETVKGSNEAIKETQQISSETTQAVVNNETQQAAAAEKTTQAIQKKNEAIQESQIAQSTLNKDFTTQNKEQAEAQLSAAYEAMQSVRNKADENGMINGILWSNTEEGAAAGYNLGQSFMEGVRKGLSVKTLQQYLSPDWENFNVTGLTKGANLKRFLNPDSTNVVNSDINKSKAILEDYANYYKQVVAQLEGQPITSSIQQQIEELVQYREKIREQEDQLAKDQKINASLDAQNKSPAQYARKDIQAEQDIINSYNEKCKELENNLQHMVEIEKERASVSTEIEQQEAQAAEITINKIKQKKEETDQLRNAEQQTANGNIAAEQQEQQQVDQTTGKIKEQTNAVKELGEAQQQAQSTFANSAQELLNRDFYNTGGKKAATTQLREAYKQYQNLFGDQVYNFYAVNASEQGAAAGYAYAKAYAEAIRKGVAQSTLQKYAISGGFVPEDGVNAKAALQQGSELSKLYEHSKAVLQDYAAAYQQVYEQMGNQPITEDIAKGVQELVKAQNELRLQTANGIWSDEELKQFANEIDVARNSLEKLIKTQTKVSQQNKSESKSISKQKSSKTQHPSPTTNEDAQAANLDKISGLYQQLENDAKRYYELEARYAENSNSLNRKEYDRLLDLRKARQENLETIHQLSSGTKEESALEEHYNDVCKEQIERQIELSYREKERQANQQSASKTSAESKNKEKEQTSELVQAYETLIEKGKRYTELMQKQMQGKSLTVSQQLELQSLIPVLEQARSSTEHLDAATEEERQAAERWAQTEPALKKSIEDTAQAIEKSAGQVKGYGQSLADAQNLVKQLYSAGSNGRNLEWTKDGFNASGMAQFGSEVKKVQYTIKECANGTYEVREAIKSTTAATSTWESIVNAVGKRMKTLGVYLASFVSVYRIFGMLKEGVSAINEFNTQLTEMRKVSDYTTDTLKRYQDQTFAVAKEVGSTAATIQASTADYLRLGKTLEESAELAKNTSILMSVSEFSDVNAATEAMISMTQAFKEMSSMEIIDELNKIGNNFSISTSDLAMGMQTAASTLTVAGNSFEQSLALMTAGNAVIQDYSKTATGLRTISLRIMGTKAAMEELEDMGEDVSDYEVTTTAKMAEQIEALTQVGGKKGVNILTDNGNLRSTYDILLDIAKVWDQIREEDEQTGQNRQQALLEQLAGKVRASIAASILENPEILEEVYAQASDAAGSAEEELGKYLESTEGKLQQFNNAVQEIWATTLNSDFINWFIDLGTAAAEAVTKMGGLVPAVSALAGALISATKNIGVLKFDKDLGKITSPVLNFGNDLFGRSGASDITDDMRAFQTAFQGVTNGEWDFHSAEAAWQSLDGQVQENTKDLLLYCQQNNIARGELDDQQLIAYAGAMKKVAAQTQLASVAMKALTIAGNALIMFLASKVIQWAGEQFYNLTHQVENARKAAGESAADYQSLQNEIESLNSELEVTGQRIDELNAKQNLTLIEKEELAKLYETNDELQRRLKIEEGLAAAAGKQANNDAKNYFNKESTYTRYTNGSEELGGTDFVSMRGNQIQAATADVKNYQYVAQQLEQTEKKMASITDTTSQEYKWLEKTRKSQTQQLDNLASSIRETYNNFQELDDSLLSTDQDAKIILNALNDYYDLLQDTFGDTATTIEDTIEEVLSRPVTEGLREQLIKLAQEAPLTVGVLEEDFGDLVILLGKAGIELDDFIAHMNAAANPDAIDYNALRQQLQTQLMEQAPKRGAGTIADSQAQKIEDFVSRLDTKQLDIYYSIRESQDTGSWSIEDWEKAFKNAQKEAKKGITVKITTKEVGDLKGASDNISTLMSVYDDFVDDMSQGISLKNLDSIVSAFDGVEGMSKPLNDFVDAVTDAGASADQQLAAFDQLLNAYLDASGLMEQMNGENGEYIQAQLEASGVELQRCEALSEEQIALIDNATAGEGLLETTANLQAMTWEDIEALAEEIGVTDETSAAFYSYMYAKLSAAGVNFDTSSDIGQLAQVCEALGAGAQAWANYYAARAQADAYAARADAARARGRSTEAELLDKAAEKTLKDAGALAADATSKINSAKLAPVGTKTGGGGGGGGGGSPSGGGGGGGSGSEPSESEFDLIQRRLEILDKQREDLLNRGESSYLAYFGLSEDEINRAVEILNNADAATADSLEELAIMAQNAGMSLQEFFEAMESVGDYSSRESNLYLAIQVDTEGIELATQAVEQYDQIAEEALSKLSAEQQEWVKKGDMQVLTLIDDEADAFQEALDAWDQRQDAIDDLNQRYIDYLDDIQEYYDLQNDSLEKDIDLLETRNSLLDTAVSYAESAGQIVDPSLYSSMIANSQSEQAKYRKQIKNRQEELEALIDPLSGNILNTELYRDIQAEIMELESNLAQCAVDQADWNYEITQIPINLMQQVTDLYQEMSTQLQNWGAEEEAAGRKLDADYYQSLIQNGLEVIDQLQRQKDLLEDVMDETDYAVGSDKWYEVYSALQDVNGEISSMVQNLYEWNQALIDMPLESISGASSELEMVRDALQSVQDDYDTVITAVTTAIQNYRDDLEKELEDQQDEMQDEIDALQDRLDLLNKQNEALKYQTALEHALWDLENAVNQRTQRVKIIARTYSNIGALKYA